MTRGLKLFPRIATYSTHRKQSPKLSGCGYRSVLSQEWGRTVLSPGRLLRFQHALLDGWDLALPIRALAQSAGLAVALPCSPAPQHRLRWQLQGKDCEPCPELGCKNHPREDLYLFGFMLISCTHSPPHRDVHVVISVQHHMARMWKDDWFLPGLWGAPIRKQQFKMEGVSTSISDTASSVPARQGGVCLQSQKVFETACSEKGICFYSACDGLILYSDTARVDLIMLIKNNKWFHAANLPCD